MNIRYGNLRDAKMLSELGAQTFYDSYANDNTPEDIALHIKNSFSIEIQSAELSDPAVIFLITELDDSAIGYAKLKLGNQNKSIRGTKPLEIERIYVLQKHIGKGIGKRLMESCISEAKQRGCNSVWLGVWEGNGRAIEFYKKQGFSEAGEHVFKLGDDLQRDLIMELEI